MAPSTLAATPVEPFAPRPGLSLAYRVQAGLTPTVDTLALGPMKIGDSEVAGSMPTWRLAGGGLLLRITQPAEAPTTVVAGAFATPVAFAAGTVFGMRAVFADIAGPHGIDDVWAVTVAARTGNERHLASETLAAATLQVRADGGRLNTPGASVPANLPNVPQDVYDSLIGGSPFTLELLVDRAAGVGSAVLRVGTFEISRGFTYSAFTSTGGPTITAIGPTVAIANAPGQSASVTVLDFQVFK